MKRTDVEQLVRQMPWPEPSASLRSRVLSDPSVAERPILERARVAGEQDPARKARIPMPEIDARRGLAWRRAGMFVALGLLLTFGSCTSLDVWADRQVEAEIARIEARYGSLDEKAQQGRAVPAADNRAALVRAAAALAIPVPGQFHYVPHPLPSPVPTELRAFAESNRLAIRLAAEIRTRRQSDWKISRTSYNWPALDTIRVLSDAIYVTTLMDLEAGRPDDAASLIVSGLGISTTIRQDRQLIQFDGVGWRHIEATRRLVTSSTPSKAALKELAWWLNEDRTPGGMRRFLLAEVAGTNAMFARMENGDIDPGTAAYIYPMTWPDWPSAFLGIAARIGRPFVRTARLRYLQQMEQLLDAEFGPRPRAAVQEPPTPERWALINRLTEKFTAGTWRHSDQEDLFASQLSAAEIAVALRRFKLDRQAYPDNLSALTPTYLVRLPIDPFTGRPPVYARQGEGFTLRGKGPNPAMEKWFTLEWNVPK